MFSIFCRFRDSISSDLNVFIEDKFLIALDAPPKTGKGLIAQVLKNSRMSAWAEESESKLAFYFIYKKVGINKTLCIFACHAVRRNFWDERQRKIQISSQFQLSFRLTPRNAALASARRDIVWSCMFVVLAHVYFVTVWLTLTPLAGTTIVPVCVDANTIESTHST